ncbi:MAG: hypothetical protein WDN04_23885 [Rhodospirillales bacterium]
MADARDGVTDAERAIIARLPANVRRILVFNKIDLAGISARREARTGILPPSPFTCRQNPGRASICCARN